MSDPYPNTFDAENSRAIREWQNRVEDSHRVRDAIIAADNEPKPFKFEENRTEPTWSNNNLGKKYDYGESDFERRRREEREAQMFSWTNATSSTGAHAGVYHGVPSSDAKFCSCGCKILIFIGLGFALGCLTLLVYLALTPRDPHLFIDNAVFRSFNLSTTSRTLDLEVTYNITAQNPNKRIVIKFDGVQVLTFVRADDANITFTDGVLINNSSFPEFQPGHGEDKTSVLELKLMSFAVSQSAVNQLALEIKNKRVVLRVRATANVRMKFGAFGSKVFWHLHTLCDFAFDPSTVDPSHPFSPTFWLDFYCPWGG